MRGVHVVTRKRLLDFRSTFPDSFPIQKHPRQSELIENRWKITTGVEDVGHDHKHLC